MGPNAAIRSVRRGFETKICSQGRAGRKRRRWHGAANSWGQRSTEAQAPATMAPNDAIRSIRRGLEAEI
eukprot:15447173-Alexandrium_andersonii.AAC.1